MFTVMPITPQGFWLCSLSCPLHPRVFGYVHCHVRYTPGFLVMFTALTVTPWLYHLHCAATFLLDILFFTGVFLIIHHSCSRTPTVRYCTGGVFSHQGDTAADLWLLLSSFCIPSSCVSSPAEFNQKLT